MHEISNDIIHKGKKIDEKIALKAKETYEKCLIQLELISK